jgi:hypothetical protein
MNRKGIFALVLFTFICHPLPSFAQQQSDSTQTLRGKIIDAESGTPIPFAHIISLKTLSGTISSQGGLFELTIPQTGEQDSLRVTCLGYEKAQIAVPSTCPLSIKLSPTKYSMEQVTVTANQSWKKGHLGMRFLNPIRTVYGISSNNSASYYIKKKWDGPIPFKLDRARVHLAKINNESIIMRVRFLEVDTTSGLPGKPIINQNLTTRYHDKKGWIEFDFQNRDQPLWIDQSEFYLVFDWVDTPNTQYPVAPMFSYSLFSSNPTLWDPEGFDQFDHPIFHTLFVSYTE